MSTPKKPVAPKNTALHSAIIEACAAEHPALDPHLKAALDLSSLVSKVEAGILAVEPTVATVLAGADAIAPEQYKPAIEAMLAAVQELAKLVPAPTPAPVAG